MERSELYLYIIHKFNVVIIIYCGENNNIPCTAKVQEFTEENTFKFPSVDYPFSLSGTYSLNSTVQVISRRNKIGFHYLQFKRPNAI